MNKKAWSYLWFCAAVLIAANATTATDLHYTIRGKGEPVILIHGGLVDSRMWDAQVPELEKHFQVIRYDLRGFGKSPASAEPVSHIDDLRTLMQSLKIGKATIIGLSLGGMIAIDFALQHPEMVDKLILAGSALRGYDYKPIGNRDPIYEAAKKGNISTAVDLWMNDSVFVTARADPDVEKKMREMLRDNSKAWTASAKTIWPKQPSIERLSEINLPTLIIVGDKDNENIVAIADVLKEKIARSQKQVMTNTGHHMNMENPQQFNAIVLQFLSNRFKTP